MEQDQDPTGVLAVVLTDHVAGTGDGAFTVQNWTEHVYGDLLEWAVGFREDIGGEFRWSGTVLAGTVQVLGPEGVELARLSWETAPLPSGYIRVSPAGGLDAELAALLGGQR
ncbi:hypothetical protein [Tsukamurella soli]